MSLYQCWLRLHLKFQINEKFKTEITLQEFLNESNIDVDNLIYSIEKFGIQNCVDLNQNRNWFLA